MAEITEDTTLYLPGRGHGYTTHFCSSLQLCDSWQYEVGVIQFYCPSGYQTMYDGQLEYYSLKHNKMMSAALPPGYYTSAVQLLELLQNTLEAQTYELSLSVDGKFSIRLNDVKAKVRLSPNLAAMLGGFPLNITKSFSAEQQCDLSGGNSILYVNSDCVVFSNVGNEKAQILCAVPVYQSVGGINGIVDYQPARPVYVPIYSRQISSITLEFRNQNGDPYPMHGGPVLCVLHIRPCRSDL